jgi:hypothetical protein
MSEDRSAIYERLRKEERERNRAYRKEQKRLRTPEELYRTTLDGYAKIIQALTSYKGIPGPNVDIESEVLVPSDKIRLRLLKGLGNEERENLIKQIGYVHLLGVNLLKTAIDIHRQEQEKRKLSK